MSTRKIHCPACAAPGYGFLLGFPAANDPLFGCGSCGHVALATGKVPTPDQIRAYMRQIDQSAFLETLHAEEARLLERTGDKDHARAFFAPLYSWFEAGLAPDYAPLVLSHTETDSQELDAAAWSLFRKRMLRYPAYLAPNTLRAYGRDFSTFRYWCRGRGVLALPAAGEDLASYVQDRGQSVKASTIKRELSAIGMVHKVAGCYDPTDHIEVRMAIKDLVRRSGSRPNQKAAVRHDAVDDKNAVSLDALLQACSDTLIGLRNRALLSVAMDAGLRASELVQLQVRDLRKDFARQDAGTTELHLLFVEKSKTDQERLGSWRLISAAARAHVDAWLQAAGIEEGYVFRPVYKGTVNPQINRPLNERTYRNAVKEVARAAGLPATLVARISTHSFRIGAVQELSAVGADLGAVMRSFDMKDPRTAARYAQGLDLQTNPQVGVLARRAIGKA